MADNNLYNEWLKWCSNYATDNPDENKILWNSLKETQVGWKNLLKKAENTQPIAYFGERTEEDEKEIEVLGDVLDERGKKYGLRTVTLLKAKDVFLLPVAGL